jgi:hypothetical protein
MSWEKVIKRGAAKRLDHDFLKEVAIQEAQRLKGQVLNPNEFDTFIEGVRDKYAKRHRGIKSDRIRNSTTIYLKNRNLLETKPRRRRIVIDGKFMGYETVTYYEFL